MVLLHIGGALPSTMHLPISSEDTLHIYRYLCIHVLIADEQFLLLINVPIQDHTQQLEIYKVFNIVIPHGNFSACYNINCKYIGITYDKVKAMAILEQQLSICQKANGQFCSINAPLQPLANPPSCIIPIYTKNKARIEKGCSLQIRNGNSVNIPTPIAPNVWILTSAPTAHLSRGSTKIHQNRNTHPHYSTTTSMQHYITTFSSTTMLWNSGNNYQHIPQHRKPQHDEYIITRIQNIATTRGPLDGTQHHHLVNLPTVPIDQLYKHMVSRTRLITPFMSTDESVGNTPSIWTLFSHTGIYIMAIGSLIHEGLGIFCCYFFWCWPARLAHWPLQSGSLWHTIGGMMM